MRMEYFLLLLEYYIMCEMLFDDDIDMVPTCCLHFNKLFIHVAISLIWIYLDIFEDLGKKTYRITIQ